VITSSIRDTPRHERRQQRPTQLDMAILPLENAHTASARQTAHNGMPGRQHIVEVDIGRVEHPLVQHALISILAQDCRFSIVDPGTPRAPAGLQRVTVVGENQCPVTLLADVGHLRGVVVFVATPTLPLGMMLLAAGTGCFGLSASEYAVRAVLAAAAKGGGYVRGYRRSASRA
jgi:hypothetical protein